MKWIAALVLVATSLTAQEKAPPANKADYETAIIPVKTLTGDSFQRLANMLRIFDAKYQADDKLRTIVVYAPKDVIAHMRKVIEALDRPGSEAAIGRNIEMTLTLLNCGSKLPLESKPLSPDLEPVAKQLRATSLCEDVSLWEVIPLRLQEGKVTDQSLRLPGNLGEQSYPYYASANFRIIPETVTRKDTGRYVRFAEIRINLRIPNDRTSSYETGITTAGEFKEGQKSVIGKTSGSGGEGSIFIVIELKVLD
jgi:hypothetical protein